MLAADPLSGAVLCSMIHSHSLGGLVALEMASQLQSSHAVEVAGVMTVCSPLAGVPLLSWINHTHPTLAHFLKHVRAFAWYDPRRALGEFIRVEPWLWEEMACRRQMASQLADASDAGVGKCSVGCCIIAASERSEPCKHNACEGKSSVAIAIAGAGRDVIVPVSSATRIELDFSSTFEAAFAFLAGSTVNLMASAAARVRCI